MSIFMNYAGLEGRAADEIHAGWLELTDICFGVQRRISAEPSTRKDRESASARFDELTLTRFVDKASPALYMAACCGRGADAVIRLTKAGAGFGSELYMECLLQHALISSYEVDAYSQGNTRPTEMLTLSFRALDLKYTPYDDDGKALPGVAVGFDAARNLRR